MKKTRNLLQSLFLSVFLIGCLFALPVNAGTIEIKSGSGFDDISYTYNTAGAGMTKYTGAGMMTIDYNGYQTFAFCVQPDLSISVGNEHAFDNSSLTISNQIYVEWLLDMYADVASSNSAAAAGLQLAIWEVMIDLVDNDADDDYNLDYDIWEIGWTGVDYIASDDFSYTRDSAAVTVNQWYDSYITELVKAMNDSEQDLANYQSTGNYFIADLGDNVQNIIIKVVPEPSTVLMFALGLLGFSAMGRKRA
mgnify:CR=1 FL=1